MKDIRNITGNLQSKSKEFTYKIGKFASLFIILPGKVAQSSSYAVRTSSSGTNASA